MLNDLSMSDCRLNHDVELVEDEVEVRGEECTLRGGQESYRRRISIAAVARRRDNSSSHYRYSSKTWCFASLGMGWTSSQTTGGEQVGCEPGSEAEQSKSDSPGVCIY